jgi:hypothetical protein
MRFLDKGALRNRKTWSPLPSPTDNESLTLPELPAVDPVFSSASFTYDGDGNRVSQTINGVTTYFVGNYYELTGAQVTKYYYAGAQRVATPGTCTRGECAEIHHPTADDSGVFPRRPSRQYQHHHR